MHSNAQAYTPLIKQSFDDSLYSNPFFNQNINELLAYTKYATDTKTWASFESDLLQKKSSFESLTQKHLHKNLYELGNEISLNRQYSYNERSLPSQITVGFVTITSTNPIAPEELNYMHTHLEKYCDLILSILATDSTYYQRFLRALNKSTGGTIPINLVSNPIDAQRWNLAYSPAQSEFNFYRINASQFRFEPKIYSRYFSPLSTASFLHELIHVVIELIRIPEEHIIIEANNRETMNSVVSKMKQQTDITISEGIAEYISHKHNPLFNSKLFNSVGQNINWLSTKLHSDHTYNDITECYTSYTCSMSERILALHESHSFVSYLVDTYGWNKVFELATAYSEEIPYNAILGDFKDSIYAHWKKSLLTTAQE